MSMRSALFALIIAVCAALAFGCNKAPKAPDTASAGKDSRPADLVTPETAVKAPTESDRPLLLWTDPALATVLQALNVKFQASYAPGYSLAFLDKGDLLLNLQNFKEGTAPRTPDVYIFTGKEVQQALLDSAAIDEVSLRSFAGDTLVLVSRPEDTYQSSTLFDVSKLRFKQLAVADPAECMLGVFTEQAMITDGLKPRVEDRLALFATSDELVDGVLDKSLDVAIIYASRAAQTKGLRVALPINENLHEDIVWKAAAAQGRGADTAVTSLLSFLAENADVQQQYEAYGFTRREVAMVEDK